MPSLARLEAKVCFQSIVARGLGITSGSRTLVRIAYTGRAPVESTQKKAGATGEQGLGLRFSVLLSLSIRESTACGWIFHSEGFSGRFSLLGGEPSAIRQPRGILGGAMARPLRIEYPGA